MHTGRLREIKNILKVSAEGRLLKLSSEQMKSTMKVGQVSVAQNGTKCQRSALRSPRKNGMYSIYNYGTDYLSYSCNPHPAPATEGYGLLVQVALNSRVGRENKGQIKAIHLHPID